MGRRDHSEESSGRWVLPIWRVLWLGVDMEISGLLSGIVVGIIIGLIARILVPSMQPIGCFVTILIGVVGGAGGALVGSFAGWGFWLTFGTQVLIATILVAIVAAAFKKGT